jgi:hypothetical protein
MEKRKISPPPGLNSDLLAIKLVASCYTDATKRNRSKIQAVDMEILKSY